MQWAQLRVLRAVIWDPARLTLWRGEFHEPRFKHGALCQEVFSFATTLNACQAYHDPCAEEYNA
jgi:hypothetical protein